MKLLQWQYEEIDFALGEIWQQSYSLTWLYYRRLTVLITILLEWKFRHFFLSYIYDDLILVRNLDCILLSVAAVDNSLGRKNVYVCMCMYVGIFTQMLMYVSIHQSKMYLRDFHVFAISDIRCGVTSWPHTRSISRTPACNLLLEEIFRMNKKQIIVRLPKKIMSVFNHYV